MGLVAPLLLAALGSAAPIGVMAGGGPPSPWIVELRNGTSPREFLRKVGKRLGIEADQRYEAAVRGFAAELTATQRAALAADPRVAVVVRDGIVRAAAEPTQELQPGVSRVGAVQNVDRAGSLDVDIAILDTGIQTNNADLNVVGGYNCTNPSEPNSYGDGGFGHGTHVAGIAAARSDGRGVEGVAAGARLWSIKVLDHAGLGYWSWIICGLDRVAAMRDPADASRPRIEVMNMSLAGAGSDDGNCGRTNHDVLHQAICRVVAEGVTVVAAAGNAGASAADYVPAAYDEVITVSGMADYNGLPGGGASPPSGCGSAAGVSSKPVADDAFAPFSNHGPDVDLIAPAVCVLSTLPGSRFARMTGTSMATPHVAGGAALYHLAERRRGHGRPAPHEGRAGLVKAGRVDWRTESDRGGPHEPTLRVENLDLAADFALATRPQLRRVAGGQVTFDIVLARLGGFTGSPQIAVVQSTLPPGASSSVAAAAGAYAQVTIALPSSPQPGTYHVEVRGTSGARVATAMLRLIVEARANGGPWIDIRRGATSGAALPVVIKWPAVANATRYHLQRSRDGDSWSTVGKTARTRLRSTTWPGAVYQFRVRAKVGGVWRAFTYGASSVVVPVYPPVDIAFSGTWSRQQIYASYGELPMYSTQAGARAVLDFVGRGVAWISSKGPSRGYADVYVDDKFVKRVNLYASSNRHRQVVFSHSWSGFGAHTLRIEVVGAPSTHKRVDVDALLVIAN